MVVLDELPQCIVSIMEAWRDTRQGKFTNIHTCLGCDAFDAAVHGGGGAHVRVDDYVRKRSLS